VDKEIRRRASLDEDVPLLPSLTGVDVYTALLIRSEIGCISRFPDYKNLVSWAGLALSLHQSGSVTIRGGVTKQGSKMLRWIRVESAFSFLKTQFGLTVNRVRGVVNVSVYDLLSVLCHVLVMEAAENVGRPEKAVSPTFFNT